MTAFSDHNSRTAAPDRPFALAPLQPPLTHDIATALLTARCDPDRLPATLAHIHRAVLQRSDAITQANYTAISGADLQLLFTLYDRQFFSGILTRHVARRIAFGLSTRMTSSAGKTTFRRKPTRFEIRLSLPLLSGTFADVDRAIEVNGVACHDRLEATMRVFEHELIHLLEFMLFSASTCAGPTFKRLSWNLFRHTRQTHQLVTPRERAATILGVRVGSQVSFQVNGQRLVGTVYRITKRATVMVPDPDGPYVDSRRQRYAKYYVPVDRLRPCP